jgi:hypothetical protein
MSRQQSSPAGFRRALDYMDRVKEMRNQICSARLVTFLDEFTPSLDPIYTMSTRGDISWGIPDDVALYK